MNRITTTIRIGVLSLVILVGLMLASGPAAVLPARAQGDSPTTITIIPISVMVPVPCAAGGTGELVAFSGNMRILEHAHADQGGGFHFTFHTQLAGLKGVGLTTGDRYQYSEIFHEEQEYNGQDAYLDTSIRSSRIIGQGPGNNFVLHVVFHIRVTPDGVVTAFVDNTRAECK